MLLNFIMQQKITEGNSKLMEWIEVNIYTTSYGVEPVCGRLMQIGITGFVIKDSKDFEEFLKNKTGNWDYIDDELMQLKDCETCVTVYLADNSQGNETLSCLRSEISILKENDKDNDFGRLAVELKGIREEDWANNWKQYFKPFTVGEKLVIKPSWEDYTLNDKRIILEIDPASSFGTGQHHTTRLCLEMMEKHVKSGDKLLDLGCGSGILSIAGILLGAGSAVAVDIEKNSADTALENAVKNNITEDKYKVLCGNIINDEFLRNEIGCGYDILTVNIVADVIITMCPFFKKFISKDSIIILSGIISERCQGVINAMSEQGYTMIETIEDNDWIALVYRT